VEDGVPYAIDFMNPAPDADRYSVGEENFEWIVDKVAKLAVSRVNAKDGPAKELRWASLLGGASSVPGKAKKVAESELAQGTVSGKKTAVKASKGLK